MVDSGGLENEVKQKKALSRLCLPLLARNFVVNRTHSYLKAKQNWGQYWAVLPGSSRSTDELVGTSNRPHIWQRQTADSQPTGCQPPVCFKHKDRISGGQTPVRSGTAPLPTETFQSPSVKTIISPVIHQSEDCIRLRRGPMTESLTIRNGPIAGGQIQRRGPIADHLATSGGPMADSLALKGGPMILRPPLLDSPESPIWQPRSVMDPWRPQIGPDSTGGTSAKQSPCRHTVRCLRCSNVPPDGGVGVPANPYPTGSGDPGGGKETRSVQTQTSLRQRQSKGMFRFWPISALVKGLPAWLHSCTLFAITADLSG